MYSALHPHMRPHARGLLLISIRMWKNRGMRSLHSSLVWGPSVHLKQAWLCIGAAGTVSSRGSQCYVGTEQCIPWQFKESEYTSKIHSLTFRSWMSRGNCGKGEDHLWKALSSSPKPQDSKSKYRCCILAVRETSLVGSAFCSKELMAWFRGVAKTHVYKLNLHRNFPNRQPWL